MSRSLSNSGEKSSPNDIQAEKYSVAKKWIRYAAFGIWLLCAYFLVVLLFDDTLFGIHLRKRIVVFVTVISLGGVYLLVRWGYRRGVFSIARLKNLTIACGAILFSLMVLDIAYSVYFNLSTAKDHQAQFNREIDPYVLTGEAIPRRYFPTEKGFRIHKPNVVSKYTSYGDMYYGKMRASPTVVKLVLELRQSTYFIDEYGFRETTPIEHARIFALGDSYTFGVNLEQDKTWVELLERRTGEPIYNLGVSGSSPLNQLELLEYVLQTTPAPSKIHHLLWMICEGNDLEEMNESLDSPDREDQQSFTNHFGGTSVEWISTVPSLIKRQSVINRFRTGRISFVGPSKTTDEADPYVVDGVRLAYPLYHSSEFGYSLFYPQYVERACKPESYVLDHPNRPLLDKTFKDMVTLSQKYGFKVTVLIAPCAPRLYGPYFQNFPSISNEPYFMDYVENLSRGLGFNVINLYQLMQPYAGKELLYWRDDSHWNERGNEVVAEILARQLGKYLASSGDSLKASKNLDGFMR